MSVSVQVTGAQVVRCARSLSSCSSLWLQQGERGPLVETPLGGASSSCSTSRRWRHTTCSIRGRHTTGSIKYYSQPYPQVRTEHERLDDQERVSLSPLCVHQELGRLAFSAQLRGCSSPSDVLDLLAATGGAVPHAHLSTCLMRVWETTKKMAEGQRRYERRLMFEHPGLEALLRRVMAEAWRMSCIDVAYSLLAAVQLGVPQRSRVVHTLLTTCQEKLNEFDERSLSVLASSLEHLERGAVITALKEDMRLKMDSDLPSIKTVVALQTMMRILGKDSPLDLKKKLERKALSMKEQFTLPNCLYMISTMAALDFYSNPLLDVCSKKIRENVHNIPFSRLISLLRSCRELSYRDTALLMELSGHVADTVDMWTNKQLILLLLALEELVFCPTALMEVFSQRVMRNPEVLTLRDLQSLLKIYSSLNWADDRFVELLIQRLQSYLSQMSSHELLNSVYRLCLLGHFPPAPLELLLKSSVLEELNNPEEDGFLSFHHRWMLQTVERCLRLDLPEPRALPSPLDTPRPLAAPSPLDTPRPLAAPSPLVGRWLRERCSPRPVLSQCLQSVMSALPGASLQEGVLLQHFYMIDAVITTKPLDNAQPSPAGGSIRTAVMCVPSSALCYGTSHPRAHLALKIRHVKKLGYCPLMVTEQQLGSMSQEEVAQFIRTHICSQHHPSPSDAPPGP